jgi:hypothetical protein
MYGACGSDIRCLQGLTSPGTKTHVLGWNRTPLEELVTIGISVNHVGTHGADLTSEYLLDHSSSPYMVLRCTMARSVLPCLFRSGIKVVLATFLDSFPIQPQCFPYLASTRLHRSIPNMLPSSINLSFAAVLLVSLGTASPHATPPYYPESCQLPLAGNPEIVRGPPFKGVNFRSCVRYGSLQYRHRL